jgi:putative Holliday junction resolvase
MKKRILAVDLGTKRVGLALSDPLNIIAQAYDTISYESAEKLAEDLNELVELKCIGTIVFGLPVTMRGTDSQKTKEVRELVEKLRKLISEEISFELEDESMTSKEAEAIIRQMGKQPFKNKALIDQIAAQRILQQYMERFTY